MAQTYRDPGGGQRRSARAFVSYNLTLDAVKATYAEPILLVDVEEIGRASCRERVYDDV